MTPSDLALARTWIGRTETTHDIVSAHAVAQFRATFGAHLAPQTENAAPLGFHWCLATDVAPTENLDDDGHAKRGAFLPPCPLPKRMAAGGAIELYAPLRIGGAITRVSTIEDVTLREGRAGQLLFVAIAHDIACDGAPALRETQSLVFRGAGASAASGEQISEKADISESVEAREALLFRYSAMTFNAHRIHYDRDYAREAEGYAGLVVHGPLQATLLMNLAARLAGPFKRFEFQARAPVFDGVFQIEGRKTGIGASACWTRNAQGGRAMSATASS